MPEIIIAVISIALGAGGGTTLIKLAYDAYKAKQSQTADIKDIKDFFVTLTNDFEKLKAITEENTDAQVAVIKDRLKQAHTYLMKRKPRFIDGQELESLLEMYKIYKKHRGENSYVAALMRDIERLPLAGVENDEATAKNK